jgi:uncharacterized membrane protein
VLLILFRLVLLVAAGLCSLVGGFLFAFAVVVMSGIKSLDDVSFIRAFQVIDRVIQNNQPLFVLVWVGSGLAVVVAALMSLWTLTGVDCLLTIIAARVYLFGVQLPTVMVNVPLNNQLQRLEAMTLSEPTRQHARAAFEPHWNRANALRTICASLTTGLLLLLLLRL